ncbi:MAG: HlyD family efflux transporter periplasmic adaptor subunit [Alphaproteobacteria bacterium]
MRLRARHVGTAVAVATVAAALIYAFRPQPVLVDLGEVTRGPLAETVREEGYTRVREVYMVSAPVAGRLLRLDREVGDAVAAGITPLARIRPTDPAFLDVRSQSEAEAGVRGAEANLALARAEVGRARAQVTFAAAELARARELMQRGTISSQTLERRQLELDTANAVEATARASVRARLAELEQVRARLIAPSGGNGPGAGAVEVTAPVDGRVLRLIQESETVVAAGAPLLELGDPRDLEIVAELLSTDAVRLAAGAAVRIFDWGGPATLGGRIRRIEPFGFKKISALGIEEQRVNVLIDFTEAPPEALGHGYRVEIEAVAWAGAAVARIPLAALFRVGSEWAAFAVDDDGRARLRSLRIGHQGAAEAELLDGLADGDKVVLHPDERIADGTWVAARQSAQ